MSDSENNNNKKSERKCLVSTVKAVKAFWLQGEKIMFLGEKGAESWKDLLHS